MTNVLCFDLETCGRKIEEASIVEIAIIVNELETWKEKLRFSRRFRPRMKMLPGAVAVHHITDADVASCELFATTASTIVGLFNKVDVFVGHNIIEFDFMVIAHELSRAGLTLSSKAQIIDTMQEGRFATPDGKLATLGELCWSLNVNYNSDKAHAALYDVEVNSAAFKRGYDLGLFKVKGKEDERDT